MKRSFFKREPNLDLDFLDSFEFFSPVEPLEGSPFPDFELFEMPLLLFVALLAIESLLFGSVCKGILRIS
jgi:hypothetical protein